ncbi:uroporphyrinogen-III synthase [Flagellimonas algicola]|uniref:Uroporphyrinogen-III synthase n=1 Tax=Flagellimonas algicola TaxID=2583815 RepID=A0ABY2WK86_9FLAO|nr:uroporphyrinogen-III synthase [Allomuricauda algicola]TMU54936.1 uroporphyrinogen-III synthase [Allomuricauda algicola]
MKTVLSTKVLSHSQKELFLNSGIGLVEYNALKFNFLEVDIPQHITHLIFTSKNAVRAFLDQTPQLQVSNYSVFCVGEKTKLLLEKNYLNVVKMAENASELAHFIQKQRPKEHFLFICGNRRREELPNILSENNIRYDEIEVYQTELVPKKFNRSFEGLLFFSPSGIKSFLLENSIKDSWLFCIGHTTAQEAKKYSKKLIIANKPTVENVLVQAINKLKTA